MNHELRITNRELELSLTPKLLL